MRFNYQARTKTGEIQTGIVEASNKEAAFNVLKAHDLYPTLLEKSAVPFYARELKIFQRVRKKDIVSLSRQLAILFKSDVPIVESFKAIARQTRKQDLKEKILKIAEKIEGGTSLSEALSNFPKLFSPFYINMVKSGEASGKISEVFSYLADYLEKESYFRSKIRGAMVYPAFVLFVFVIVVSIIVTYVIPQLAPVLITMSNGNLPFFTRAVLWASDFLTHNAVLVIGVAVAIIGGIVYFVRSAQGKRIISNYSLSLPLIGPFLKKYYLSRFALNLSTLVSAGLPIARALDIAANVIGNERYKKIIIETREGVKNGETISSIIENYPDLIAPLFYQMVSVGERTGNLGSSLKNVVSFYQREVDQGLDSFVQLLEPTFIILLGGVVGGLMAAVMIPLYSLSSF